MTTKQPKYPLNVEMTRDYRLVSDGRQYLVLERYMIDPTKSPAFDPAKMSADKREGWREVAYYGLTSAGLAGAIDYVSMRSLGGEMKLAEFVTMVRRLRDDIRRVIPVELSAK